MKGIFIFAVAGILLSSGVANAQVTMGAVPPPLGMTSPLGMGPTAPVGATGIPLGATELATPGVSPGAIGPSMQGVMSSTTGCSGGLGNSTVGTGGVMSGESSATGVISGTSAPTPLFDGAGIGGTASGTCATGSAVSSSATGSASSPTLGSQSSVGRLGVPLGSTELSTGGLSPLPDITTQIQPPIVSSGSVPCPTTGMPSSTGTSMSSGSC